eukprot:CCRYP_013116-RA/>CCRYP_013116-RA protein AED:0.38 eAED:1.00 QI:0/-1/0/1/-1/0/1/0/50
MVPRQGLDACLAIYHETQAQSRVGHVGAGKVRHACRCSVWLFDCVASILC